MFRSGWRYIDVSFYWLQEPASNHVPVYRAWNGSDHFLTVDQAEYDGLPGNYAREGIAGYVAQTQEAGHVALHRAYHPTVDDHQYTIDKSHIDSFAPPLQYEGILGYVRPAKSHWLLDAHVPVYFAFNAQVNDSFYTSDIKEILINGYDTYPLFKVLNCSMDCTVLEGMGSNIATDRTGGTLMWKIYDEGINYITSPYVTFQFFVNLRPYNDDCDLLVPTELSLRLFRTKPSISNPSTIPNPPEGEGGTGQEIINGENLRSEDTNLWKTWISVYFDAVDGSWEDITGTQLDEEYNTVWPHIVAEGVRPRTWCRARPGSGSSSLVPVNWYLRVAQVVPDCELAYYAALLEARRNKRLKQYAIPFLLQQSRRSFGFVQREVGVLRNPDLYMAACQAQARSAREVPQYTEPRKFKAWRKAGRRTDE